MAKEKPITPFSGPQPITHLLKSSHYHNTRQISIILLPDSTCSFPGHLPILFFSASYIHFYVLLIFVSFSKALKHLVFGLFFFSISILLHS